MRAPPKTVPLSTSKLGRVASLARAGMGSAASLAVGSVGGLEMAVARLGELRGIGTKVGQMAGLVEAGLSPEMRAKVGPSLAKLRADAARSPYEAIARVVEEELGAPPDTLFAKFDHEPFASASIGQVHRATHIDGRALAVKVQHPGIREAFRNDLESITSIGRVATAFVMPEGQGKVFLEDVKAGFLAELDYEREAQNLRRFARLVAHEADLESPETVDELSSTRVLTTTFLRGESVEQARAYPHAVRARQAAAVRRFVLSALTDHGVLYADAHAGNFLFRADGSLGVLDFGSVFVFDEPRTRAFADMRDAVVASDDASFVRAVARVCELSDVEVVAAIADVQLLAFGALVRGDEIDAAHVRRILARASDMKRKLLGRRVALPSFLPFLMRTLVATNSLLAAFDAPASGALGKLIE